MFKRFLYFFSLLFISQFLLASKLDSLRYKLSQAKNDSNKIEILFKTAKVKANSERFNDFLLSSILSFTTSNDCYLQFFACYKVGTYYANTPSKEKSVDYLLKSLALAEKCKNSKAIMQARVKLGLVNKVTDHIVEAKLNLHMARHYAILLKEWETLAESYTILGNIYKNEMLLDSALDYHLKALKIREDKGDKRLLAITYNNLGLVYKNKKEYATAMECLRKSIQLKLEVNDNSLASSYNNLGIVFSKMKMFDSAIAIGQKGIKEALVMKQGETFVNGLDALAEAYDLNGDIKNALHYYKRLKIAGDSINKEQISIQFQDMQAKYESDKKDIDIKLKEESLRTAKALDSKKNMMIGLSSLAFILALAATVLIFRSYKQSKRNAEELKTKNQIIEEKNKEITDSINYAKNIQQSLITSEQVFTDNLNEHFILYLPKDIVSGDFYWAEKVEDGFIIMCADCTGHGVPGAFMSLLGIGYLKEIVNQKLITQPDAVLNELRQRIIESFGLNKNKDGMDASLVKINKNQLQVSAANNAIWIVRENELVVVKPNKFPIGTYFGEMLPFTLNEFQLMPNDLVIMFTDGYADQFGGEKNKKFNPKNLEKLIVANKHLSLTELKQKLADAHQTWKSNYDQVDDILVIGFRV